MATNIPPALMNQMAQQFMLQQQSQMQQGQPSFQSAAIPNSPFYRKRIIGPDPQYYAQSNRGFQPTSFQGSQPTDPNAVQPTAPTPSPVAQPDNWDTGGGDFGSSASVSGGFIPGPDVPIGGGITYNDDGSGVTQGTDISNAGGQNSFLDWGNVTYPQYDENSWDPPASTSGGFTPGPDSGSDGFGSNQYAPGASITNPDGTVDDLNASLWDRTAGRFIDDFSMENLSGWDKAKAIGAGLVVNPLSGIVGGLMGAYDKGSGASTTQPDAGVTQTGDAISNVGGQNSELDWEQFNQNIPQYTEESFDEKSNTPIQESSSSPVGTQDAWGNNITDVDQESGWVYSRNPEGNGYWSDPDDSSKWTWETGVSSAGGGGGIGSNYKPGSWTGSDFSGKSGTWSNGSTWSDDWGDYANASWG